MAVPGWRELFGGPVISAVTGEGVVWLLGRLATMVEEARASSPGRDVSWSTGPWCPGSWWSAPAGEVSSCGAVKLSGPSPSPT